MATSADAYEIERQARIQQGLAAINHIYGGGGNRGTGRVGAYTPGKAYYDVFGRIVNPTNFSQLFSSWLQYNPQQQQVTSPFVPTKKQVPAATAPSMGKGSIFNRNVPQTPLVAATTPNTAAATTPSGWDAFMNYMAGAGNLYGSREANPGFGDFFGKAQNAYLAKQGVTTDAQGNPIKDTSGNYTWDPEGAYATQQQNAARGLMSYYGGRGTTQSSTFDLANKAFKKADVDAKNAITGGALDFANEQKRGVLADKNQLISQLYSSADPTTAAQQAAAMASNTSIPNMITPLQNLFTDWANLWIVNKANQPYGQVGGSTYNNYNRNNFASSPVSVVRNQ